MTTDKSKLQLKTILTLLEVETTALADQIGQPRPIVSEIVNGGKRKAKKARLQVVEALNRKIADLIIPEDLLEEV